MEIVPSSSMDNQPDDKATDLMIACQNNNVDKVGELLKENASSSDKDPTGKVALHYCAENGTLELVQKVLEGDPSLLDHRDEEGYTPLTFAVIGGNEKVAEYLINKGADINSVDSEKHSLVHWATVCGQKETLELILKHGALVSLPDLHGAHPIHYATQLCETKDGLEILQMLLKNGADVNCADLEQRTPLLWACSCGSQKAFVALCEAGADKKCTDKDRLSSVHCAASRGHADMVDLILSLTADVPVDAKDRNGCSALFYAATLGHVDCTRALLKNNAQPNFQDKKLRTAAHCAAAKGQLATLKLLWQHGASFDLGNHRGDLPIHEAAQAGSIEVVEFLLLVNANNKNARNHVGRTPLHLAAANGDLELCKFLMEKGTNPDALMLSKNQIFTSLDVAEQKRHQDVVDYLKLVQAKKATELSEPVIEEFKQSIITQIPEKKIELIESVAQTETPEKIDQSVEVEVHVEPERNFVLEENQINEGEEKNNKTQKQKKKKSKHKSKSPADELDSSDDELSNEERNERKSKERKSASNSRKRSKHKKDKKAENTGSDKETKKSSSPEMIQIVTEEQFQLKDDADSETKGRNERRAKKDRKKSSKQDKDNSDTDIAPESGSETKTDNANSPTAEPSLANDKNSSRLQAAGDKTKKKHSTKKEGSSSSKQNRRKGVKNRSLSIISEENANTVKDNNNGHETKTSKTTSSKGTITEPLSELTLLNNVRTSNAQNLNSNTESSPSKKQNARKISVEQALFTDNLKGRPVDTHSHSSLQVQNFRIRDSQSSALTTRSSQNSSIGLYRRHRNRYCETCNLAIPVNVNKYVEEKRIFQELANLKRMQIQYGKVQENILVKRLMEDFFRQYNIDCNGFHVDTFHSWEQFLYDQLQRLYQHEQDSIRIKRLHSHSETSLFQKRLQERSIYGNKERIDTLTKIYATAPLPLQYAPNLNRSRIL